MKTIRLLVLLLVQALFFSCSDRGAYTDSASKQIIKRSQLVTRAVDQLTPRCKLLAEVDKSTQDTVLARLSSDIVLNRYEYKQGLFPSLNSSIKFVPVISAPIALSEIDEYKDLFQISKDVACFLGLNDKGEMIYFCATYSDNSNFTKDTNPDMYKVSVEVFGQEFADKDIEKIRSAKGTERWSVTPFRRETSMCKEFEFARNQSDNGAFFVLTREKRSFLTICFFKDKKPYYCCETDQRELHMEPLENYLNR